MPTLGSHGFVLEHLPPDLLKMGTSDLQGELVIFDEHHLKHLVRSSVHHFLFTVEIKGTIPVADGYSFLDAKITQGKYGIHLIVSADDVLCHSKPSYTVMTDAVETCAGLGFLGQGLQSAGLSIRASNELRPNLCKFRWDRGCKVTIEGDIHDKETWKKIHRMHPSPALGAAGFSCQPWSRLGDGRMQSDERSQVLPALLQAAYHLRIHSLILECVPQAGEDAWVQGLLKAYCHQTGSRMAQQVLHLQSIFPAVRTRWWCLITNCVLPPPDLPPLPLNPTQPTVGDLLPTLPQWEPDEVRDLQLDQYETRNFYQYGGLNRNLVRDDKPMPTALHGWANQLGPCPCDCRRYAMSDARLSQKGLFGALLIMPGSFHIDHQDIPCTRHVHPWEVAVTHGVNPDQQWGPRLRMALCGLGQMASPIHACWVAAHYMKGVNYILGKMDAPSPQHVLWNHIQDVLKGMAPKGQDILAHPKVIQFACTTKALLQVNLSACSPEALLPGQTSVFPHAACGDREPQTHHVGEDRFAQRSSEDQTKTTSEPKESPAGTVSDPQTRATSAGHASTLAPGERVEHVDATLLPHAASGDRDLQTDAGKLDFPAPVSAPSETHARGEGHIPPPLERILATADIVHHLQDHEEPTAEEAPAPLSVPCSSPKRPITDANDHRPHKATRRPEVFSEHGGVMAFQLATDHALMDVHQPESHPPAHADVSPTLAMPHHAEEPCGAAPSPEAAIPVDDQFRESFAQSLRRKVQEVQASREKEDKPMTMAPNSCPRDRTHLVQVVREGDRAPAYVRVSDQDTVGMLSLAEHRLGKQCPLGLTMPAKIVDAVGIPLQLAATTQPFQQIHLLNMPDSRETRSSEDDVLPDNLTSSYPTERLALLYQQGGFVARDEMDFWLRQLETHAPVIAVPTLYLPQDLDPEDTRDRLMQWTHVCANQVTRSKHVVTALVVDGHWFPVVIKAGTTGTTWITTPEGRSWVQVGCQAFEYEPSIATCILPTRFAHDCGFQSYEWIKALSMQNTNGGESLTVPAMLREQAIALRSAFEHHLVTTNTEYVLWVPQALGFGGATTDDMTVLLRALLVEHGVPEDNASERADRALHALGRTQVQGALRGPRPWKDIKGLANAAIPKFQLVMSHEMADAIKHKTNRVKTFGDKNKKKTHSSRPPLIIGSSDVCIPEGLFQDAAGDPVKQVQVEDINPDACGIVLANTGDVMPYLRTSKAFSSRSLALLLLDHHSQMLHGLGEEIRTPAKCSHTGEAIILTCRMVQIGTGSISRKYPTSATQVEEVPNCVVRIVAFRDEFESETKVTWEAFCKSPVREILQCVPELKATEESQGLMDCWDRQFLSMQMQRTRPQEAQLFIVAFRLQTQGIDQLLGRSGRCGLYIEPREADGRRPSQAYRVIWLGKSNKTESLVALRSTSKWSCLARTSRRYGLRVHAAHAMEVHAQHKPTLPYLDTVGSTQYTGGPFPFGATRSTLTRLFNSWGWAARPNQPIGRSLDGKGVTWSIQAKDAPQFQVYTLAHADVLLAEVPWKQKGNAPPLSVQGSAKTIAAIKQQSTQASDKPAKGEDPFLTQDPWHGAKFPKSTSSTNELPRDANMDVKIAQMEKRIMHQVEEKIQQERREDEEMIPVAPDIEVRTSALEQRLASLEQTVQNQHAQQAQHNQEVAGQIQQINAKVDTSTATLQQHMDSRLSQQLTEIERIISQKRRTE
eukprot:Skav215529  [mRNA]  locus=scaffold219:227036:232162:+ [translate_table: standard]